LTVSDDGGGYGESILTHKGLGLQGIYWRLAILQGDLAVYYKDQRQYHKITIPLAVCEAA
jgi:signal transduction histidine kinase